MSVLEGLSTELTLSLGFMLSTERTSSTAWPSGARRFSQAISRTPRLTRGGIKAYRVGYGLRCCANITERRAPEGR